MNIKEIISLPTLTICVVATRRIARPSQRMAALLRLAMERPCLVVAPCHTL